MEALRRVNEAPRSFQFLECFFDLRLLEKSDGHAVAAGDHVRAECALMAKTRAVAPTLRAAHLPWIESNSISKISMALGPMAPPAPRGP
jgi:hypothetical protein